MTAVEAEVAREVALAARSSTRCLSCLQLPAALTPLRAAAAARCGRAARVQSSPNKWAAKTSPFAAAAAAVSPERRRSVPLRGYEQQKLDGCQSGRAADGTSSRSSSRRRARWERDGAAGGGRARRFRQELDEARAARCRRWLVKKQRRRRSTRRRNTRRRSTRRRRASSSDSESSSSDEAERKKKKHKKEKKEKADAPMKLSNFSPRARLD